jgi:hypothetical protein
VPGEPNNLVCSVSRMILCAHMLKCDTNTIVKDKQERITTVTYD